MSVYQRSAWSSLANIRVHQRFKKTALRAVGPLYPPALSPPAKAPVAKGGQAGGKGFRGTAEEHHALDRTFRG